MNPPRDLRLGILGAARIAPEALVRPARRVPGVIVAAVAARDPRRAETFARRHGIPKALPSYESLVANPELDAIYIPLPASLHAECCLKAMAAGKHVLCEKPLASNADEATQLADAARQTGRVLMEGFHYRYHPFLHRMKAIVDSGELGALRCIEAHFCVPLLIPGDIRYRYELGGGATMDLGCYTINLIRHLADAEPKVVSARAKRASPQIDRFMEAEFELPDGCRARMTCSICSALLVRSSARVIGERGELRAIGPYHPHKFQRLKVITSRGSRVERIPGETTFVYQLRAFAAAVREGGPVETDARDAIANLRVIDGVYERAGLQRRGLPWAPGNGL
jgi:predicted dehydrogenase